MADARPETYDDAVQALVAAANDIIADDWACGEEIITAVEHVESFLNERANSTTTFEEERAASKAMIPLAEKLGLHLYKRTNIETGKSDGYDACSFEGPALYTVVTAKTAVEMAKKLKELEKKHDARTL